MAAENKGEPARPGHARAFMLEPPAVELPRVLKRPRSVASPMDKNPMLAALISGAPLRPTAVESDGAAQPPDGVAQVAKRKKPSAVQDKVNKLEETRMMDAKSKLMQSKWALK